MIDVAFLFAGEFVPRILAARMIHSVQTAMPQATIYHQTDMETPEFPGCQTVRMPWEDKKDVASFFWKHIARFSKYHEHFIKLDYDCVMLKDVSHVFDCHEKIILTLRENDGSIAPVLHKRHPHNAGVMFANGYSDFWQDVCDCYHAIPNRDGWMDGCDALDDVVRLGKHTIKDIPAFEYNYTPKREDEVFKDKYILHYKGGRKHWGNADTIKARVAGWMARERAELWLAEKYPELCEPK